MSHSARMYTEMARREGFEVLAVDAFADVDTIEAANEFWQLSALGGQLTQKDTDALISQLDAWQPEAVLIGSGFEADVEHYELLHQRYPVLGNPPAVIRQVKDPEWLAEYCNEHGVMSPEIQLNRPLEGQWLYKEAGQCGGTHVKDLATQEASQAEIGYWQRFQEGQAVGALFVVKEQKVIFIGVHALKQRPDSYTYAGTSRLNDPQLFAAMQAMLEALVPDSGLIGINSVDAIWQDGRLYLLEINPRFSASMRLYAKLPLIQAHVASCKRHKMPVLNPDHTYASHCICYALQAINIESIHFPDWLEDRPAGGSVTAGQPLCSFYAEGQSESEVKEILQDKKTQLEKIWGPYVCEHIEFNIH